jgi:hypothetical protein
MLEFIGEEVIAVSIGIMVTGAFGAVAAYFRKKTSCLQNLASEMEELRKRTYRIEKALVVLVKLQEDAVKSTHPEIKPEWEEIVKELLRKND